MQLLFCFSSISRMDTVSRTDSICARTKEFYRLSPRDSNDQIKSALRELLEQWTDVLDAANDASEDDLFYLNVSRALLHRIFVLAFGKDCFKDEHSFTRDIFRLCSELLLKHIDVFTNQDSTSTTTFLLSNVVLIMEILAALMSQLWCADSDLINEQLILAMREYVDRDSTNRDLVPGILSFIWNLSDNTSLVPILLKTNYVTSLYQWIQLSSATFRDDNRNALINILHNMLRNEDAIDQFNRLDISSIIERVQFDVDLSFSLEMIHILLADVNHIQLESMEFPNRLISMTISAGESEDYRHEGFHVCELFTGLAKLFYNDEIRVTILKSKPSLVEFFAALLIKFYPNLSADRDPLENFTCVLLMNILCRISYDEEYSPVIYANEELMSVIQNAMKNEIHSIDIFMPRTMKSIEQVAIEIWNNFNEKSESVYA